MLDKELRVSRLINYLLDQTTESVMNIKFNLTLKNPGFWEFFFGEMHFLSNEMIS